MPLIGSRRTVRVVWTGEPFAALKSDGISINAKCDSGPGGDPPEKLASTAIYIPDNQPDVPIDFGWVEIEQNGQGSIWVGAGPKTMEGTDGQDYEVWMVSSDNVILAEEEEIEVEVTWHVTAVT